MRIKITRWKLITKVTKWLIKRGMQIESLLLFCQALVVLIIIIHIYIAYPGTSLLLNSKKIIFQITFLTWD